MRTIGVLIYDLGTEYNYTVANGIISYFENRNDVRLLISSIKIPHDNHGYFDYQFWSSVELLKTEELDGYIIVPNSFSNYWDFEALAESLKEFSKKPVVSVGVPLNIPNLKYTSVSCEKSYDAIVSHILNKHNKTKIAFFSAELTYTPEADIRFQAFKKALEKNGLEFNPEFVLPGDFTPGTATKYIQEHYKVGDKLPFEAIVCANDHTAVGCMSAFEKIGINCPKDILIFGYDDSPIASKAYPTISTINQYIEKNGYMSAKMLDDIITGKYESPENYNVEAYPVFRQSCGCVDCSIQTNAYIDQNNVFHGIDRRQITATYNINIASSDNIANIYQLLNLADAYTNLDSLKYSMNPILDLTHISSLSVCLYKDAVELNMDDDFVLPEEAYVASLISKNQELNIHVSYSENKEFFNPKKYLVPDNKKEAEPGIFFLIPLFMRNKNYGYMICKFRYTVAYIVPLYAKILTNTILLCYENQKAEKVTSRLIENTENLDFQSKTDELTGLFNRRGFLEFGDRLIDLSLAVEKEGLVFFCDMDGLKKINDTYGHKIGDLAIKTQATILQKSFRESDLVGRLSGDEFGVVAPGYKVEKLQELRDKICEISKEESKKAELPFTLSISVGYEEFFEDHNRLQDLLIAADKRLYEEKLIKHGK